VAAFKAGAQVDPLLAGLEAFFATLGAGLGFLVVIEMGALGRHEEPPGN
jgi:hypothetical protein